MTGLGHCSVSADKLLENFSQQQGVWRYCVWFLQVSQSQHVLMYSLNLLEVSGRVVGVPGQVVGVTR